MDHMPRMVVRQAASHDSKKLLRTAVCYELHLGVVVVHTACRRCPACDEYQCSCAALPVAQQTPGIVATTAIACLAQQTASTAAAANASARSLYKSPHHFLVSWEEE
jgi:hypothetical protein